MSSTKPISITDFFNQIVMTRRRMSTKVASRREEALDLLNQAEHLAAIRTVLPSFRPPKPKVTSQVIYLRRFDILWNAELYNYLQEIFLQGLQHETLGTSANASTLLGSLGGPLDDLAYPQLGECLPAFSSDQEKRTYNLLLLKSTKTTRMILRYAGINRANVEPKEKYEPGEVVQALEGIAGYVVDARDNILVDLVNVPRVIMAINWGLATQNIPQLDLVRTASLEETFAVAKSCRQSQGNPPAFFLSREPGKINFFEQGSEDGKPGKKNLFSEGALLLHHHGTNTIVSE